MAGIRALLGFFPKTGNYESKRNQLESEYKELIAFKASKEVKRFHELENEINSNDFQSRKKEIHELRYKNTEDYLKEKEFLSLKNSRDIKLYYKVKESGQLKAYEAFEKSAEYKKFNQLEAFVNSEEFSTAKKAASESGKQKFINSDLYKSYQQYQNLKNDNRITDYFRFQDSKYFAGYNAFIRSKDFSRLSELEKEINSQGFIHRVAAMKKAEYKESPEKKKSDEYKSIIHSRDYKHYKNLMNVSYRKHYEDLKDSDELEAFTELKNYINSEEFRSKRKSIETSTFKDTQEYVKLQEYNKLKRSAPVREHLKFKASKELKNYLALKDSERISKYEALREYIESDEFKKFRAYCLKSPRNRWLESKEYEKVKEYTILSKSQKIVWFLKNYHSRKFEWFRRWEESFMEDFSSPKLDTKRWLTKYYYGDKIIKDSYSLSHHKHFITDGRNLTLENKKLRIITRKESVKGKSWDPNLGFVTRDFAYTSGLISTGESFRQTYGTFEAKMKIHPSKNIRNAFWMVGKSMVPHIDIANAGRKLFVGNAWGDARDRSSIRRFSDRLRRGIFTKDYFIFSLEWLPGKLTWRINGVEVATTTDGVPDEPMYLLLSAGLEKDIKEILPADFAINWIRCFKPVAEKEK